MINDFFMDEKTIYKINNYGESCQYPIFSYNSINSNILNNNQIDFSRFSVLYGINKKFINLEDHINIIQYHNSLIKELYNSVNLFSNKEFIDIFVNNFDFLYNKKYKYYDSGTIQTAFNNIVIYYKLILEKNYILDKSMNKLKRMYNEIIKTQKIYIKIKLKEILESENYL